MNNIGGTLMNVEADALSRLTQGSSVPVCLQHVPRVHPPVRNDSWFLGMADTQEILPSVCYILHDCTLLPTKHNKPSIFNDNCCFAVLSVQASGAKMGQKRCTLNFAHAVSAPCNATRASKSRSCPATDTPVWIGWCCFGT